MTAIEEPTTRAELRERFERQADRHRASPPVKQPREYRCGDCGGKLRVIHLATGTTWRTEAGYRGARDRIGEKW